MGIITKPNTFSPNTTAQSAQVNADLDTIYTEFNGEINDANIAALAQIQQSKILNLVGDLAAIHVITNAAANLHMYQAQLTVTQTTSAPNLVAVPTLEVATFVSGGRRFLVSVTGEVDNSTTATINVWALYIDGLESLRRNFVVTSPSVYGGVNAAFTFITPVLSVGNHSATMYFACDAGLMYARAGALLQLVELPGYTT